MGQVTQATIEMIREFGERKKHAPLTINEEQQLAHAWESAERYRVALKQISRMRGHPDKVVCIATIGAARAIAEKALGLSVNGNGGT